MRDDAGRLQDIADAIERIERHGGGGRAVFDSDELVQTWVLHHIQIVGEAAAQISEDFKARHPEVPWKAIAGMRNIVVHQYFGIDLDQVWQVVEKDIPSLKRDVQTILEQEERRG
jgi:uncharacterized protein with HEPN domain